MGDHIKGYEDPDCPLCIERDLTVRGKIQSYLDGDLDFAKLWYLLSQSPEVQAGWETIEYYDVWAANLRKGRNTPPELEEELRERLRALLSRWSG